MMKPELLRESGLGPGSNEESSFRMLWQVVYRLYRLCRPTNSVEALKECYLCKTISDRRAQPLPGAGRHVLR